MRITTGLSQQLSGKRKLVAAILSGKLFGGSIINGQ